VVADTSVYITHPDKLEQIDFVPLVGVRGDPIHLVVPVVVIDELDGLKQGKDNRTRWRAGYTLAVLDRVSEHNAASGRLRAEDFSALDTGGVPAREVRPLGNQVAVIRLLPQVVEVVDKVADRFVVESGMVLPQADLNAVHGFRVGHTGVGHI
jgi:hypothetical protein